MIALIRKIDLALKEIYNLDSSQTAEEFLIQELKEGLQVRSANYHGALLIKEDGDLNVGIYLDEEIKSGLMGAEKKEPGDWNIEELNAFAVATEEISHLNYLIYVAGCGRQVSQLELELQGEIDRFVVFYYAMKSQNIDEEKLFQDLLERFFSLFRWKDGLAPLEKDRYAMAHSLARRFFHREAKHFSKHCKEETRLRFLRTFYRLNAPEKLSRIGL